MPTSPTQFNEDLWAALHGLLWRQWSSLGVAGEGAGDGPARALIDPEALVLATSAFGRRDARLFDETLDWLIHFGSLINVQRLKNLHTGGGLGDARVLRAMAACVQRQGRLPKWGSLSKAGAAGKARMTPEPFFISNGTAVKPWGEPDRDFRAQGWLRSAPRLRGLSMPPAPGQAANALVALRALIGVSSRCEIILCLLSRSSATAAELARLTGYSAQSVQSVLNEMSLSGRLFMNGGRSAERRITTVRGKSRRFSLHAGDWGFVVPAVPPPQWFPWAALYAVVQGLAESLAQPAADNPVRLGMQLRRTLEAHAAALADGGFASQLGYHPDLNAEELVATLAARLPAVLGSL